MAAHWQLRQAGVPQHRIGYRQKQGWLEPIHPGVYRVGPVSSPLHREMAAVLACGPGAVVSHQSAGALWDLHPRPSPATPIAISTTSDIRGRGPAIRVYRVATLGTDEVTTLDNLPLTTPARTLLDLAGCLGERELEQALARADRNDLLDRDQIDTLLARYPRRRGRNTLRTLLSASASPAFTRSEAEELFLALIRKGQLRPPQMNAHIHGFEVDALWRSERLIAEIDGYAFHSSKNDFERDRHRDSVLAAAGYSVMRITWKMLATEPEAVLVRLALALATRGSA